MRDQAHPPRWILRFFRWFCHPDFVEDIEGDLLEIYEIKVDDLGKRKANQAFFWAVISLIKPNLIRPLEGYNHLNHYGMYKNYFKIAWRSLWRQKLYSFINIGGLSIGLTCFILIFLYIRQEHSYDRFYPDADQIYRVYERLPGDFFMGSDYFAYTPAPLGATLKSEFPEIEAATTIRTEKKLLSQGENHFWEEGLWADESFFDVFALSFLNGEPNTALNKGNSIVITNSLSSKIFHTQNPIGKPITLPNDETYTVTAVIQDPPANSSLQFTYILSFKSNNFYLHEMKQEKWSSIAFYTFIKLSRQADPVVLEENLKDIVKKYVDYGDDVPVEDIYLVQSLQKLHLSHQANFDIGVKGNPGYVKILPLIALVVLALACSNYMNLAIAQSLRRTREVGLRKTVGASQKQLIKQFLFESWITSFFALFLAISLVQLILPSFAEFLERDITFNLFSNPLMITELLVLVFIVGIVSGSYPALIISSFNPVKAFRGSQGLKFYGFKVQKWLIIGQYIAAIVLIISSLIMYQQFHYIQKKELGYTTENIITCKVSDPELSKYFEKIKNKLESNPNVVGITSSGQLPTNIESSELIKTLEGDKKNENLDIYITSGDYNFLNVFGIKLLAGRNFSQEFRKDQERGFLINEKAAMAMGWTPQEAIGKRIAFSEDENNTAHTIIGVVKDFHLHSMHMDIAPLMIGLKDELSTYISIHINPHDVSETIQALESTFEEYSSYPFEYSFLDEKFRQLYQEDIKLGIMFRHFTILSVLIASLGLFGLAVFSAQQKTKEIGVRKVLGATIQNIIGLLAKDFLQLVFIGFVLAVPISWYLMRNWLEDFAYRIQMPWWTFIVAGLGAILVAFLAISYQSIQAALANPVDSLRNE